MAAAYWGLSTIEEIEEAERVQEANKHEEIFTEAVINDRANFGSGVYQNRTASRSSTSLWTSSSATSSSTVPGIGMMSGRVAKWLGKSVINATEEQMIRHRLRTIRRQFQHCDALFSRPQELETALQDLLDFRRCNLKSKLTDDGYPLRIVRRAESLVEGSFAWSWRKAFSALSYTVKTILIKYYLELIGDHSDIQRTANIFIVLLDLCGNFYGKIELGDKDSEYESLVVKQVVPALCGMLVSYPNLICDEFRLERFLNIFIKWKSSIECLRQYDRELPFLETVLVELKERQREERKFGSAGWASSLITAFSYLRDPLSQLDPELPSSLLIQDLVNREAHFDSDKSVTNAHTLIGTLSVIHQFKKTFLESKSWEEDLFSGFHSISPDLRSPTILSNIEHLCGLPDTRSHLVEHGVVELLQQTLPVFNYKALKGSSKHPITATVYDAFKIIDILGGLDTLGQYWNVLLECLLIRGCSIPEFKSLENPPFHQDLYVWGLLLFREASKIHHWCHDLLRDYRVLSRLSSWLGIHGSFHREIQSFITWDYLDPDDTWSGIYEVAHGSHEQFKNRLIDRLASNSVAIPANSRLEYFRGKPLLDNVIAVEDVNFYAPIREFRCTRRDAVMFI